MGSLTEGGLGAASTSPEPQKWRQQQQLWQQKLMQHQHQHQQAQSSTFSPHLFDFQLASVKLRSIREERDRQEDGAGNVPSYMWDMPELVGQASQLPRQPQPQVSGGGRGKVKTAKKRVRQVGPAMDASRGEGSIRHTCDPCTLSKIKCQVEPGQLSCERCLRRCIPCVFSEKRRCGPKRRKAGQGCSPPTPATMQAALPCLRDGGLLPIPNVPAAMSSFLSGVLALPLHTAMMPPLDGMSADFGDFRNTDLSAAFAEKDELKFATGFVEKDSLPPTSSAMAAKPQPEMAGVGIGASLPTSAVATEGPFMPVSVPDWGRMATHPCQMRVLSYHERAHLAAFRATFQDVLPLVAEGEAMTSPETYISSASAGAAQHARRVIIMGGVAVGAALSGRSALASQAHREADTHLRQCWEDHNTQEFVVALCIMSIYYSVVKPGDLEMAGRYVNVAHKAFHDLAEPIKEKHPFLLLSVDIFRALLALSPSQSMLSNVKIPLRPPPQVNPKPATKSDRIILALWQGFQALNSSAKPGLGAALKLLENVSEVESPTCMAELMVNVLRVHIMLQLNLPMDLAVSVSWDAAVQVSHNYPHVLLLPLARGFARCLRTILQRTRGAAYDALSLLLDRFIFYQNEEVGAALPVCPLPFALANPPPMVGFLPHLSYEWMQRPAPVGFCEPNSVTSSATGPAESFTPVNHSFLP
jgi:hypothetical protein